MNKYIFLDRDGTVIKDYDDEAWKDVNRIEPINKELLGFLITNEFTIIFISNQYLMEEGYLTNEQFYRLDKQFIKYLKQMNINKFEIKYAYKSRAQKDYFTKPNTGMIVEYMYENKLSDFRNLVFIGDSTVDREVANKLQLNFFDISTLSETYIINELKKIYSIN